MPNLVQLFPVSMEETSAEQLKDLILVVRNHTAMDGKTAFEKTNFQERKKNPNKAFILANFYE